MLSRCCILFLATVVSVGRVSSRGSSPDGENKSGNFENASSACLHNTSAWNITNHSQPHFDKTGKEESKELHIFRIYVDTAVYSLYIVVGLALNGTLILMFVRNKEIRTSANSMILNLAVCDVLNLGISGPLHFFWFFKFLTPMSVTSCRCYLGLRQFFRAAGAFSLLALSIQRFCITVPGFHGYSSCVSSTFLCLSILSIWLLALSVSLTTVLTWGVYSYICASNQDAYPSRLMFLLHFLMYCVLLTSLMFVFNFLTARRLKRSVRNMPGELHLRTQEQVRNRSAHVMMALSILFVVCYLPYELWCVIFFWTVTNRMSDSVGFTLSVCKYFLFADACFNPVALFIISKTFRRLFRQYWGCLCCRYIKTETGRQPKRSTEVTDSFTLTK